MYAMKRTQMLRQHEAELKTTTVMTPPGQRLEIKYHKLDDLRPNPKNPREHGGAQLRKLAANMRKFGFIGTVIIDPNLTVICGHGRVEAARMAGIAEIPTVCITHLTPEQLDALMVADNRSAELSSFHPKKLGELFLDLSMNPDLDLETTAFSTGEIDFYVGQLEVKPSAENDPADAVPQVPKRAVSKRGVIWRMGPHLVSCADSREENSYQTLMTGQKASMVISDPPYNIAIPGIVSGLGKIKHANFEMAVGEMTEGEFTAFLTHVFRHMAAYSVDGALVYIFMDWRHLFECLSAGRAIFTELKQFAAWVKSNGTMGSLYRNRMEMICIFKHGAAPHRNNIELGRNGRNRSNVFEYPNASFFGKSGEEGDIRALHPTPKPVRLIADAIMDVSARGDIVLDPFLGAGASVIACERTGRKCFGLEIDPLFTDVIVRRWQAWTGEQAVHAVTGEKFDDLAAELEARHV